MARERDAGATPLGAVEAADRTTSPAPPAHGRLQAYVLAGQVHVSAEPTAISTILGSCVAVCLFDLEARVGGLNHYLLPNHHERERSARFGNVAIEALLASVLAHGAQRPRLQAKVFGGASTVTGADGTRRGPGDENVKLALRVLQELSIPVVDGDVGGSRGRKLVFHTDDGSAWVRLL